eukprot:2822025-Rhodomonas_salina.4
MLGERGWLVRSMLGARLREGVVRAGDRVRGVHPGHGGGHDPHDRQRRGEHAVQAHAGLEAGQRTRCCQSAPSHVSES